MNVFATGAINVRRVDSEVSYSAAVMLSGAIYDFVRPSDLVPDLQVMLLTLVEFS